MNQPELFDPRTSFDSAEGQRLKDEGMKLAAEKRESLLDYARSIAVNHAVRFGSVTADDVQKELIAKGMPALGNAAGSLFRGPEWKFTGLFAPSERESNRGRWIRVWRLA